MVTNTIEIGTARRPLRRVTRAARTAVSPRTPRPATHRTRLPGQAPQVPAPAASLPVARAARPVAFALAVLAVLATVAPEQAAAQTETTFLSNTGQFANTSANTVRATAFTTGAGTYTLSSVAVYSPNQPDPPTPLVQIYGDTSSNPGTLVATMTNPGTIAENALNIFTAPANTTLAASTTYWLVTSNTATNFGTGFQVATNSNSNVDSGTAAGWTIGNGLLKTDIRLAPWTNSSNRHRFEIRGTVLTAAPTVANAIPDQTATVGRAFTYQFPANTFNDTDTGDTLSYMATKADGTMLPTWLGFTASTRTFAGTPAASDVETVSVKVTATDTTSATVSDEFDITVSADTNSAPTVVNAIPDQTAMAGTAFTYQVPANTFNDTDTSDTLSYTATKADGANLPTWLGFTASTRTFMGTPAATDVETVAVKVTADDSNGGTVSDEFNIVVGPDTTTEMTFISNTGLTPSSSSDSLRATSFTTGTGTYTLSSVAILVASQSGTPTPVVQIYGNAGGNPGTLVATMTNPATLMSSVVNIFTAPANTTLAASTTYWLVTSNSASTSGTGFRVNVRDNGHRDSGTAAGWTIDNARSRSSTADPWSIHISRIQFQIRGTRGAPPANSAPTVANAIPDQTATVGAAFSYQFPTNTFNDTDTGDTLSYTATKADGTDLPTWLVFTAGTRTFTGMPAASDVETVSVKVTADDSNGGTVSDEFNILVSAAAPTTVPADWSLKPTDLAAGARFRLLFLSSTKRNASSTDIATYNTFVQNRAAAGHTDIQAYSAGFRVVGCTAAVDARDNTATTYTTADTGVPIYWLNGAKVADDYQDFYDGNWDDEANDKNASGTDGPDTSQQTNYPYTGCRDDGTEFVSQVLGSGNLVVLGQPNSSAAGAGPIQGNISANGTSFSYPMYGLSEVFQVGTPPANAAPTASNGTVTTNEDTDYTFAAANFNFADTDSGDTLASVKIVTLPAAGQGALTLNTTTVSANAAVTKAQLDNGNLKYTPPANANGTGYASFTFKVNDGTVDSSSAYTMTINVTAVNDAPTVATAIPDQTATAGTAFSYQFPDTTFSDPDSDMLSYMATKADGMTLPMWLVFTASTRTFAGTPAAADVMTFSVKVTASDGNGGSVSDEFDITVRDLGICARTEAVRDALLAKITGVTDCALVTDTHLAAITFTLSLNAKSITVLAAGDFDGLTALTTLNLSFNSLTGLPAGIFDQLTALTWLNLEANSLAALPAGVFDQLTALARLYVNFNSLTALPAGVFDQLTALTTLDLENNSLTALPAGVFDQLTALTILDLDTNSLTGLPDDVFEPLTSLTSLDLSGNTGAPFSPTAVALPDDGTVPAAGGTVMLDGSGSGGAWGTNVTYSWALTTPTTGVTVTFDNDSIAEPTVTIPQVTADTDLVFTLTVTGRGSGAGSGGFSTATDTATVTTTNAAPTVATAIPDQTATVGAAFSYQFPDTTFNDTDTSDTLSYTATKADGTDLPTWLVFTASTRTFAGAPAASDVGTVSVKVTADDSNGGTVSDEFNIVVSAAAPTTVPADWSLQPTDLAAGANFRLLFLSSTKRDGSSTDIATYNTFVQERAAAGHADIQAYSAGFRVVGCTAAVDARDNTSTTYTTTDKGVRIYWLNGNKAADDYEDFYDGNWDEEANDKNESGTDGPDTSQLANRPWTGCNHNGTEAFIGTISRALGSASVRVGRPNTSTTDNGPIGSISARSRAETRPMYGLSEVFQANTPTNNAPTAADGAVTTLEDTAYTFAAADFNFSDTDSGDALESVKITVLPSAGTLRVDGTAIVAGDLPKAVSKAVIDAAKLTYAPVANASGTATFNFKVNDGTDDSAPALMTITINAVNDAPTVATAIPDQTATVGTAFIYSVPDTTFNDVDTGQTLSYMATKADGMALPTWLVFTAGTRTFAGTPAASDVGTVSVKVTASDSNGGSVSDKFDITVANTAPGAPTTLTATASGTTTINLSWTAPASTGGSAITGYKIEVSSDGGSSFTDQVANTGNATTTYAHTGLAADTTRHYRVSAINSVGTSIPSDVASATTTTANTAPGAPTTLTATASGTTTINLSWTAPVDNGGSAITGYKIEISPDGITNWTDLTTTTASTTTHAHIGLAADTTRHYRVSAINSVGTSTPSDVASATTTTANTAPGAPTSLTATASGTSTINLSWTAPGSDGGSPITGYKIEVSSNGGSSWTELVANTGNANTTYAHSGLAADTTRHYRVSAINSIGTSTASNVANATTGASVPGAPTSLSATASGSTTINLSWSAPASTGGSAITGYKIEVSSDGGSSWSELVANTGNANTTYAHSGLADGATRHYRVSAINSIGTSTASNVDDATTGRTTVTFDASSYTAEESGAPATVTVELSAVPLSPVTIPLVVTHLGGATPGDYEGLPSSVTFWTTGRSRTFTVRAIDDSNVDGGESVQIGFGTLPAGYAAGTPRTATVALVDDETELIVDFGTGADSNPIYVRESDVNLHHFTVSLRTSRYSAPDGNRQQPVTIPLVVTHRGGATPDDYEGLPSSVTFEVGESVTGFTMRAIPDGKVEIGEGLRLDFGALPAGVRKGSLGPYETIEFVDEAASVPGAPTSLSATASGSTGIDLSWTAPASNGGSVITGYKIEVSSNGGSSWSVLVADTGNANTTYAHSGLTASTTRHYRVSAINSNGTGSPSNVDDATTTGTTVPGAPTSLSATASGSSTINLSWSAPSSTGGSAITGYKIEVSSDGGSSWSEMVADTGNANTTYAHTGLAAVATRHYRVSAINANGTGTHSNVANATTGRTTVTFNASSYTAEESGALATVTVELSAVPSSAVTIPLVVTHLGGATPGDYEGLPSSVRFWTTGRSRTFTVRAIDDSNMDGGESVQIGFGTLPAGYAAGTHRTATVALVDDETELIVNFGTAADATVKVREGPVPHRLTMVLDSAPQQPVTIPLVVTHVGGATAADYTDLPASVTFAAGKTVAGFDIRAIPDQASEIGEGLRLDFGALPAGVRKGAWGPYETIEFVDAAPAANLSVSGTVVTVGYPGALDGGSTPSPRDFVVSAEAAGGGKAMVAVTAVSVRGSDVLLDLDRPVAPDETVTLSYLADAMHPIRDAAGLPAPPLADEPVRNDTPASGPGPEAGLPVQAAIPAPMEALLEAAPDGAGSERLDLSSRNLTDVSALAGLIGLRELDLRDNAITDLSPLAGLTGLQLLDLRDNQIMDLSPLAGLTGLQLLYLSGNRIEELWPLAGLTALEQLNLSDNRIGDLSPLAGLSGLQVLDLAGNRIEELWPLAGLTALERLNLSDNRIEELWPLAGLSGLQVLLLDRNRVADVSALSPLAELANLGLSGNRIADIGRLSELGRLRRLDLSGNAVADVSALGGVSGLVWLRLPGNPVSDVAPLGRLEKLRWLWLDWGTAAGMEALAPPAGHGAAQLWIERPPAH